MGLVCYYVAQVKIVLIKTVYFVIIMGPFYFFIHYSSNFESVSFLKHFLFLSNLFYLFNQKQYSQ